MSLAAAGRMRMEMCSSLVCLDTWEDYKISGRIYHNCFSEGRKFHSFLELVDILEQVFNSLDYPQNCMELRSFREKTDTQEDKIHLRGKSAKHVQERGLVATFSLRVMFRQNASWQGLVQWIEQGKSENFRSVLELMKLMNSAVPDEAKQYTEDALEESSIAQAAI